MSIAAYAPGRVELLGNHTDYNQGLVLAAAIDRGVTVTGTTRPDDRIVLRSDGAGEPVEVVPADLCKATGPARWANYPLGVFHALAQRGCALGGFDAVITSTLPIGAGLASSAALEVATAFFLRRLFQLDLPPLEIARLCREAENDFVGVPCGLLDQVTSVFGRAGHAICLDCRDHEIRPLPFPDGLLLVVAESGTSHQLLESLYGERARECAAAAAALGVGSLREIDGAGLAAAGRELDPVLLRRARHVVEENERVRAAGDALARHDGQALGALMNASHESSRSNFENSSAELDALVRRARLLPGVHGARLTGGGFGGSVVALVEAGRSDEVAAELSRAQSAHVGRETDAFVCRLADGAALVNAR